MNPLTKLGPLSFESPWDAVRLSSRSPLPCSAFYLRQVNVVLSIARMPISLLQYGD